jgi:hypothetical protein
VAIHTLAVAAKPQGSEFFLPRLVAMAALYLGRQGLPLRTQAA